MFNRTNTVYQHTFNALSIQAEKNDWRIFYKICSYVKEDFNKDLNI